MTTTLVFSHIGFPPKIWCPYVFDVPNGLHVLFLMFVMAY